jgi:hypothetical protein
MSKWHDKSGLITDTTEPTPVDDRLAEMNRLELDIPGMNWRDQRDNGGNGSNWYLAEQARYEMIGELREELGVQPTKINGVWVLPQE